MAGWNVVSTNRGYAKEYLKNFAEYCDPTDVESIRSTVLKAFKTPKSDLLKNHLLKYFSWEKTAQTTLELYRNTINATDK